MMNFDKIAIKIEQAIALMCAYLLCSKILNWLKALYVDDINRFKNIIIYIVVAAVILFFCLTMNKTHNIAKHMSLIYCWACIYLHFDALLKNWVIGIPFCFFAIVGLVAPIEGPDLDENLNEREIAEKIKADNNFTVGFMIAIMVIAQMIFGLGKSFIS